MMNRALVVCGLWALTTAAQALPAVYSIDSSHTYPSFETSHMDISVWRGKFNRSQGRIELDRERQQGEVDVRIDANSIDFGHEKMNEVARGEHYFQSERYPEIRYRGALRFDGEQPVAVDGELSLLGVSRPLRLVIRRFRCVIHPLLRREVCGADATAEFDRRDYGMDYAAQYGSTQVRLAIQVEAILDPKPGPR
jgi:polyisoprenoid-binding protein YceI